MQRIRIEELVNLELTCGHVSKVRHEGAVDLGLRLLYKIYLVYI